MPTPSKRKYEILLEASNSMKEKEAQSEDGFVKHTMYDKNGKPHEAKTIEDHLRMKKMGYTHTKASFKYKDPKTGQIYEYERRGIYKKDGRTLIPE